MALYCVLGTRRRVDLVTGGPPDDEEEVVLSTLPVLRVSCDSRVEALLLRCVAVAREKAKGG